MSAVDDDFVWTLPTFTVEEVEALYAHHGVAPCTPVDVPTTLRSAGLAVLVQDRACWCGCPEDAHVGVGGSRGPCGTTDCECPRYDEAPECDARRVS